ncbi:hypothetical protein CSV61_16085 [Sporosarcina sp. P3]|uniref:hypothetical protein n=1 Tax=Sporosarcina sp. P3 TaxID=2048245 RepID=UPI000C16F3D9|nr:hypothetical protein [Sporosarcina sp. P3]PID20167.1 hypothetical protein CSV61_16085 [Sporosarcina sp. P3]
MYCGSQEENRQLTYYELQQMAQAEQEAERLIEQRQEYFDSLYDDVRIGFMPFDLLTGDRPGSANTESQALEIIDNKASYDSHIKKLQARYRRWKKLLKQFSEKETILFVQYFERGENVPHEKIEKLLDRILPHVEASNEEEGTIRDKRAAEETRAIRRLHSNDRRLINQEQTTGKLFLINGQLIEATEEEYQAYKDKQSANQEAFREKLYSWA